MSVKTNRPDYFLIIVTGVLMLLGILVLASLSAPFSLLWVGNTYYFLIRQIILGITPGIILLLTTLYFPLERLKKLAPFLLLLNLILMIMVFFPGLGVSSGGATRWLSLGKISFQPSEFLKLTFIIYLASLLSSKIPEKKPSFHQKNKTLVPLIAFLGVVVIIGLLLILQPDVSTLGIIVAAGLLMYFLAATPVWHSLLVVISGISALLLLIKMAPYRMQRWTVFLNPEQDPLGIGYQIKQSLIAVGSGGIFGQGLGMSKQKLGFLPQPMSDSIFAIFSEEAGFVGAAVLVLLFLIFLWRGFTIAKQAENRFLMLSALGISSWICLQAFVNIGVMIGILPLAGIPLPFISYGGSHLAAELTGVGILLNISRYSGKS